MINLLVEPDRFHLFVTLNNDLSEPVGSLVGLVSRPASLSVRPLASSPVGLLVRSSVGWLAGWLVRLVCSVVRPCASSSLALLSSV